MVESYVDKRPGHMSAGMRARCLLAFAFASSAELICLDEPERALDSEAQATLAQELSGCAARGSLVLVATHDAATRHRIDGAVDVNWVGAG